MAAGAAIAVISALAATGGAVEANQQTQHAKGAAQAEAQAMNDQATAAAATDKANLAKQADKGTSTQNAALAALKASMAASNSNSILTSPTGAAPAPTQTKTLLGL